MALIPQIVPVALDGLETKKSKRWLLPGNLISSQNIIFDNWPDIKKRNGYQELKVAANGSQLANFKNQLLLGTGSEAFSFASSGLVDKGILESISIKSLAVFRDINTETVPDSAIHPLGISVYTWETSAGGVQYSVFDTATGQPIVSGVQLGTAAATRPKPLVLAGYVIIFYYDNSNIRYIAISALNPTAPTAPADFATDVQGPPVWDATKLSVGANLVVVYLNTAGANRISIRTLSPTLVISAATIPTTTDVPTNCISVFEDQAGNIWCAYYTGTQIHAFAYERSLTSLVLAITNVDGSPGTIRNICGLAPTSTTATLFYEATGSASYNNLIRTATVTIAGVISGVANYVRSVGLASKPFFVAGRTHVLAAYDDSGSTPTNLQRTYFLLSGPNAAVVAKLAPGLGGGLTARSLLPEVPLSSTGVYGVAYLQTDFVGSQSAQIVSQSGVQSATLDFTQGQSSIELSDDLHLSGGILSMYDGAAVVEHGFHVYPENLVVTAGGAGSITGTYQMFAVYEWMDLQGLIHQSGPSPVVTVVASSNLFFNYTVSSLRLTAKGTALNVVFYRTTANQTTFYRVTPFNTPNRNTTTADTVSAPANADTFTDAQLQGNQQPYTNPTNNQSALANLAAPAPKFVWRYRNRVAMIPAENPFQWQYSQAFVAGVPIQFNSFFLFQSVAQDGGPLECGAEMDDKNILFSNKRIYYTAGDGPAPNGTSSDYGQAPQSIPTDVGCSNGRSLLLTPRGLMFQAPNNKGIHLLGRDLSVTYVGAPVEAFNNLTIVGAVLTKNSRRAVFFTNGGVALVNEWYRRETGQVVDKWTTWTNHTAADATTFQGLLTYLKPKGNLWQETPGRFTDAGQPILLSGQLPILSFAGLMGFQRVWRLGIKGDFRSAHYLQVSLAFDDNPSPQQVEIANSGALLGGYKVIDSGNVDTENPGGGQYGGLYYIVKPMREKCSSIQVSFQELQNQLPYGEGLSISGVAFVIGKTGKMIQPVAVNKMI